MKRKTQAATRGLRRGVGGLLALAGLGMTVATAGFDLEALNDLDAFSAALSAQTTPADEPVPRLQRLLLGESALLSHWAAGTPPQEITTAEDDGEDEVELDAVTPEQIQPKTITGSGTGYLNGQGVTLYNRTEKTVDLDAIAQGGSSLHLGSAQAGPQILIMHTHATEAYAQNPDDPYPESGTARTTDPSHSIIRVGDEITRIFTEMGLNVIHDTTLYDYPSYNEAYTRSRAGIEAILAQHPTIQVVLDIHRDALVGSDGTIYKPVIELDGVSTAQVMMLVGSDDAGAEFPDWPEHLALVMSVQQQMNSLWPQLARPITLRTARFNQQLTKGSFLVEVGSHGNTLEEALAGARLFARAAGKVFLERCG
ncbi:MAG: stage II sporulation protein P [Ruminiclostridium sp.]|jgi:stage II sporulation protein P|nr:stage II sporulation protein P [Ruminiclostridium sp.]MCI9467382.1 stage II sporulation protein P [Ruminiclostridium sp.]